MKVRCIAACGKLCCRQATQNILQAHLPNPDSNDGCFLFPYIHFQPLSPSAPRLHIDRDLAIIKEHRMLVHSVRVVKKASVLQRRKKRRRNEVNECNYVVHEREAHLRI